MRLVFGQRHLSLTWLSYIVFFVIALWPDEIGHDFLHGASDKFAEPTEGPTKLVAVIAIVLTYARFNRLSPFLKRLIWVTTFYIGALSLESLVRYGNPFGIPHVFSKLMIIYTATAMYPFFVGASQKMITGCMMMLLGIYLYDLLVHHRDVLSLGSFMDVERGMHASTVLFIMSVGLYAYNTYLYTTKPIWLAIFFLVMGLVLFLNHRTVWLATASALILNQILIAAKGRERYSPAAFTPIFLIPFIAGVLVFSYVFTEKPEILAAISDRIADISKADEQGTGAWRLEQFQSYLPYVLDKPILGNRFEGFELPVQFIHEENGRAIFTDGSGHHFHSFYMDCLFYHGIVGLCVIAALFVYILVRATRQEKLDMRTIALVTWSFISLQYGLSYPFGIYNFALAGMALAMLDTDIANHHAAALEEDELEEDEEELTYQTEPALA